MRSLQKCVIFFSACLFLVACKEVNFKKTKAGVPYKIFSDGKSKDTIAVGHIAKRNEPVSATTPAYKHSAMNLLILSLCPECVMKS